MIFLIDALQLMTAAYHTYHSNVHGHELEDHLTGEEAVTNYVVSFLRNLELKLNMGSREDDKTVLAWDNLAINAMNSNAYQLGAKDVRYTAQIRERIKVLRDYLVPFYEAAQKKWTQIYSMSNTADDIMFMYIRNLHQFQPNLPVMFIPHNKALYSLVRPNVGGLMPAYRIGDQAFGDYGVHYGMFLEEFGILPGAFMVYRAVVGDFADGLMPSDLGHDSVEEWKCILNSAVERGKTFFSEQAFRDFFLQNVIDTRNSGPGELQQLYRQVFVNLRRQQFLQVKRLFVQHPEPGEEK